MLKYKMLDINNTACAHNIEGDICLPDNIIVKIHNEIASDKKNKCVVKMIKHVSDVLKCDGDELCIIDNTPHDVLSTVEKDRLKREYFKPCGDIDPIAWLNNTNIDEVQEQLYKKYPNYYYSYIHMIDFIMFPPTHKVDHPIRSIVDINFPNEILNIDYDNRVSTDESPMKWYGTVFNTDPSSKQGQHWFAVFFNFNTLGTNVDPFTLEYFNSAGNDINNSRFRSFFEQLAMDITKKTGKFCKYIKVTDIQHQASHTGNCGVYSLYYIWNRLEGIKYKSFNDSNNVITDDAYITKFREKMFRPL